MHPPASLLRGYALFGVLWVECESVFICIYE